MRFDPHTGYKRYRLPIFIVNATDRAVTIRSELGDETIRHLDRLITTNRVLYSCVDPDNLCLYGKPELWTIRTWNNRVSSMQYAGVKVYPLVNEWDDTVSAFFDYIDSWGVAPSSLNAMSLNLWRATLLTSVSFHEETPLDEMLGPTVIHTGGRKEARRGTYRHRVEYDITAAYPTALAAAPIPARLAPAPASWLRSQSLWNGSLDGLCVARVRIPPMHWGPLPVVLDIESELTCYGYTAADQWTTVTLPLSELRTAAESNVDVDILRCNVGIEPTRVFDRWYSQIVPALRMLPGVSGIIGKLVANRLWSCFAVSPYGVRREHTFSANGDMRTETLPADPTGQVLRRAATTYVGALIQSRVRQRLWREGINHFPDVVYIDTDGLISKPTADIPAGWRAKTQMCFVDVAAPQAVYYTCPDCHKPPGGHEKGHWTVAGAQSLEQKSRLFRIMKQGGMILTNINNVLPAQDVNAHAETENATEATFTPPTFFHDTPARA